MSFNIFLYWIRKEISLQSMFDQLVWDGPKSIRQIKECDVESSPVGSGILNDFFHSNVVFNAAIYAR